MPRQGQDPPAKRGPRQLQGQGQRQAKRPQKEGLTAEWATWHWEDICCHNSCTVRLWFQVGQAELHDQRLARRAVC